MSHWAELDQNNIVVRVVVGDNNDPNGDEGFKWLQDNLGGTWVKTSYNGNIRGIYAGVNFTYNETEDIFITPQPFPSWIREGSIWNPPSPYPTDGKFYSWNELEGQWNELS